MIDLLFGIAGTIVAIMLSFAMFLLGVFFYLGWSLGYRAAWTQMVIRPLEFKKNDDWATALAINYIEKDVQSTIQMYEGIYVFPEEGSDDISKPTR